MYDALFTLIADARYTGRRRLQRWLQLRFRNSAVDVGFAHVDIMILWSSSTVLARWGTAWSEISLSSLRSCKECSQSNSRAPLSQSSHSDRGVNKHSNRGRCKAVAPAFSVVLVPPEIQDGRLPSTSLAGEAAPLSFRPKLDFTPVRHARPLDVVAVLPSFSHNPGP